MTRVISSNLCEKTVSTKVCVGVNIYLCRCERFLLRDLV